MKDNMSDIKQHSEMMYALGEIKGQIGSVVQRLDTLNGKVASHEKRLNDSDVADAKESGIQSVLYWAGSTAMAIIVTLAIGYLAKHFNLPLP